jgi:hypothetical protein
MPLLHFNVDLVPDQILKQNTQKASQTSKASDLKKRNTKFS